MMKKIVKVSLLSLSLLYSSVAAPDQIDYTEVQKHINLGRLTRWDYNGANVGNDYKMQTNRVKAQAIAVCSRFCRDDNQPVANYEMDIYFSDVVNGGTDYGTATSTSNSCETVMIVESTNTDEAVDTYLFLRHKADVAMTDSTIECEVYYNRESCFFRIRDLFTSFFN